MMKKNKTTFFKENHLRWMNFALNLLTYMCFASIFELVFGRGSKPNCPHRANTDHPQLVDITRGCSRTSSSCIWEAQGELFNGKPKKRGRWVRLLMEERLHQLRLVCLSHYLQGFSTIPGGCLGFLPSTGGRNMPMWHIWTFDFDVFLLDDLFTFHPVISHQLGK